MQLTDNSDKSEEPLHETSSSEEYNPSEFEHDYSNGQDQKYDKTSNDPEGRVDSVESQHLHTHLASLRILKKHQTIMDRVVMGHVII